MKTLLYFGASWCHTCEELEPIIADAVLETGVNFFKYDVEEAPKIADKHKINVTDNVDTLQRSIKFDTIIRYALIFD